MLGDRVMARNLKGKDRYRYHVGRYIQFLYDTHPNNNPQIRNSAITHVEVLRAHYHKMPDLTEEAIAYRKAARMTSPIITPSERNAEFLRTLKSLKEQRNAAN